jgi:hypothetical protein
MIRMSRAWPARATARVARDRPRAATRVGRTRDPKRPRKDMYLAFLWPVSSKLKLSISLLDTLHKLMQTVGLVAE